MARNEKVEINMENGITTMIHEMKMDGHHLVERKRRSSMDIVGTPKITVLIHSRFIDDRSYIVTETCIEVNDGIPYVTTQMTQEEVQKFEEDWINLWKPEISTTFFDWKLKNENLWIVDHMNNNNLLLLHYIDLKKKEYIVLKYITICIYLGFLKFFFS